MGLSLAALSDAGLTWGAAGQMGGLEQRVSLVNVALTCFLTADKPPRTARRCDPVGGVSERAPVTPSAVEVQSWVGNVTL